MAKPVTLTKSAAETERFAFDYEARLAGETIDSATLTAEPTGLTISGDVIDGSKVSHLVAGGTADTEYKLTCSIETSGDRVLRECVTLKVTA